MSSNLPIWVKMINVFAIKHLYDLPNMLLSERPIIGFFKSPAGVDKFKSLKWRFLCLDKKTRILTAMVVTKNRLGASEITVFDIAVYPPDIDRIFSAPPVKIPGKANNGYAALCWKGS